MQYELTDQKILVGLENTEKAIKGLSVRKNWKFAKRTN